MSQSQSFDLGPDTQQYFAGDSQGEMSDLMSDDTDMFLQKDVAPVMAQLGDVIIPNLGTWSQNSSQEVYATETVDPSAIMQNTYAVVQNGQIIPYYHPDLQLGAVDLQQGMKMQKFGEELPNSQSSVCSDDGIPSKDPWAGDYNFRFSVEQAPTKKCNFSEDLNKLFCVPNLDIEFRFLYEFAKCKSTDMYLEAFLRYQRPGTEGEPVKRCLHHLDQDRADLAGKENVEKEVELIEHVMKCTYAKAEHFKDEHGRCRVRVPLGKPAPGVDHIARNFHFDCLSSCKPASKCKGNQGKNPIYLVFELKEKQDRGDRVRGRISFLLRVCSCPGRDFDKELKELELKKNGLDRRSAVKRKSAASAPARIQGTDPHGGDMDDMDLESVAKLRRLSELAKVEPRTPAADDGDAFLLSSQESVLSDDEILGDGDNKKTLRERYKDHMGMCRTVLRIGMAKRNDKVVATVVQGVGKEIRRAYRILKYHEQQQAAGGPGGSPDSGVGDNERQRLGQYQ